mgnify:CR=1 FL=1
MTCLNDVTSAPATPRKPPRRGHTITCRSLTRGTSTAPRAALSPLPFSVMAP